MPESETTAPEVAPDEKRSHRTLSGVAWTSMGYGAQGMAQLALLAVLGRILTPRDFGVVTATLVIVNLGRLCTQAVIGAAIVQRPVLTDRHIRAAFWLAVATGVIAAGAMLLVADAAASFFEMPELANLVRALAPVFLVQSLGVVSQGLLIRDLEFRAVATSEAAGNVIGMAGAGILAGVLGAGVWSLVIAHLGLVVVQTAVLVAVRRHPIAPRFTRAEVNELVYFGGGFLGGRFFNYAALQGDNLVVARTLTSTDLGAYGRAYQLVAMPAMLIGQVLDRVLFPVFSRIQDDAAKLGRDYRRGISLVLSMAMPASIVFVVAADEVVSVVLGSGWNEVVFPLRVLGVGLAARTAYKVSDTLSRATGLVYARAGRQMAYAAMVFVGAAVGQHWGIGGVSVGVSLAIVLNHLLMAQLCLASVPLSWASFLGVHVRLIASAVAVGSVAVAIRLLVVDRLHDIVTLAAVGATCAAGYLAMVALAPKTSGLGEIRWLMAELRDWAGRS